MISGRMPRRVRYVAVYLELRDDTKEELRQVRGMNETMCDHADVTTSERTAHSLNWSQTRMVEKVRCVVTSGK